MFSFAWGYNGWLLLTATWGRNTQTDTQRIWDKERSHRHGQSRAATWKRWSGTVCLMNGFMFVVLENGHWPLSGCVGRPWVAREILLMLHLLFSCSTHTYQLGYVMSCLSTQAAPSHMCRAWDVLCVDVGPSLLSILIVPVCCII